jgi:hypothetical protein
MYQPSLLQELTEQALQRMGRDPQFRKTVYIQAAGSHELQEELRARFRDTTNIERQKTALETLRLMGSAAMSAETLAQLRDLLASSIILRSDIVRLIAEEGIPAIESPGMREALLRASGDENAVTRRWCVVALSCIIQNDPEIRKRMAIIAANDADGNVRAEAEATLVESNPLHASLLNALRDSKPRLQEFLTLLATDTRTIFEDLYLSLVGANTVPILLGSEKPLSPTRVGTSGDIEWALVHNASGSYGLLVDCTQEGMEGQMVEVRDLDTGTTLLGFVLLRPSPEGLSQGELECKRTLSEQPKLHFYLFDWRMVSANEWEALQEYYETIRNSSPAQDRAHWEQWLQLASERLNDDTDEAQG